MLSLTSLMKLRKSLPFVLVAAVVACPAAPAWAIVSGGPGGTWPKSWPQELEPLREQAWTWVGGLAMNTSYDIAFHNRDQFESAWPHIVQLKSKGAPITLLRGPHVRVFSDKSPKGQTAGVRIMPALENTTFKPLAETTLILVVDGKIVDLNRIRLPADTPIIDRRFTD